MFTLNCSDKTHYFKMNVWMNSMNLRFQIDVGIVIIFAIAFQVSLNKYNTSYHDSISLIVAMRDMDPGSAEYQETYETFLQLLNTAAKFLDYSFKVSIIHLLFPINQLFETYFLSVTNRKASEVGANFYNEFLLCCNMGLWIYFQSIFKNKYNPDVEYAREDMTADQLYICNLINLTVSGTSIFDLQMALLAANSWIKLFLKLRIMKLLGPLFKVMIKMVFKLTEFMVMWVTILFFFTSVS